MLQGNALAEVLEEATALFSDLLPFRVIQIKRNILEAADEAGSIVTTLFLNMGLFTVMVGVLLHIPHFRDAGRSPQVGDGHG